MLLRCPQSAKGTKIYRGQFSITCVISKVGRKGLPVESRKVLNCKRLSILVYFAPMDLINGVWAFEKRRKVLSFVFRS